ncbi:MAG: ClpXP protease specificity-enhancing factor SspB [Leptospiraceae bacterium]|nr:ClpXP protease specificity-enhancing factor SspB [Leptospiraceae bacterium]
MDEKLSLEELKSLREFKNRVFDLYWEKFGFFYIHAMPHPSLSIGSRGLVGKENEVGIVLAFGPTACREISLQTDYLYAELQFGYKWEKVFIPWDCIFRIFDKSHNSITQLKVILNEPLSLNSAEAKEKETSKVQKEDNVISIDFTARKK